MRKGGLIFFVFSADRWFFGVPETSRQRNLGSGCLSNYCYHTAGSSRVSTIAFDAFSIGNDRELSILRCFVMIADQVCHSAFFSFMSTSIAQYDISLSLFDVYTIYR